VKGGVLFSYFGWFAKSLLNYFLHLQCYIQTVKTFVNALFLNSVYEGSFRKEYVSPHNEFAHKLIIKP
jgi:hypothetical protein